MSSPVNKTSSFFHTEKEQGSGALAQLQSNELQYQAEFSNRKINSLKQSKMSEIHYRTECLLRSFKNLSLGLLSVTWDKKIETVTWCHKLRLHHHVLPFKSNSTSKSRKGSKEGAYAMWVMTGGKARTADPDQPKNQPPFTLSSHLQFPPTKEK